MSQLVANLFRSPEELIETLHIFGLHGFASELAEALSLCDWYQTIVSRYLHVTESSDGPRIEPFGGKGVRALEVFHEELRSMAAALPSVSRILEVGTYIGGSTLALAQGSVLSNSKVTSIDLYMGFNERDSRSTNSFSSPVHWEYNTWQVNLNSLSERLESMRGASVPILRSLVKSGRRFDFIFLDTSHQIETLSELALISCLAEVGCRLVMDDVINFGGDMTTAWCSSLINFLAFPRFTPGGLAVASFKDDALPMNCKLNPGEVWEYAQKMVESVRALSKEGPLVSEATSEGLRIYVNQ